MRVSSTLSRQEETTERSLKLPNFVYFGLRDASRKQNKEFTKGKLLYEILHFDGEKPCTDEITPVEEFVDDRLSDLAGEHLSDLLDKIKIIDVDGKQQLSSLVPSNLEAEDDHENQVRVRLPNPTWEQIHTERERYLGKWITSSLIKMQESAFNSRMERINTKREIAEYLDGSLDIEDIESEVAQACVTGDSDRFTDVSRVHSIITDETGTGLPDGATVADMEEMTDKEWKEYGLKQSKRPERAKVLEQAVRDEGLDLSEEEMMEKVKEVYNIKTDSTARQYVDMMDLDWVSTVEVSGVKQLAKEIKSEYVADLPEKSRSGNNPQARAQRMPVHQFVLVDKDAVESVDGVYGDEIEAIEDGLKPLLEQAHSVDMTVQKEAHQEFRQAILSLMQGEEIEGPASIVQE
jgi:hypothetical protein